MDDEKSKGIIFNKFSMEEDKSECVINKQKDAKNEVTYEVTSYLSGFECGRNLLDRLDLSYRRVCMATPREE